jgi:copper chaperone
MNDTLNFKVEGMTCGGCARALRNALEAVPGVTVEEALVEGPVRVQIDPAKAGREDLAKAVEGAGYRPVFDAAG